MSRLTCFKKSSRRSPSAFTTAPWYVPNRTLCLDAFYHPLSLSRASSRRCVTSLQLSSSLTLSPSTEACCCVALESFTQAPDPPRLSRRVIRCGVSPLERFNQAYAVFSRLCASFDQPALFSRSPLQAWHPGYPVKPTARVVRSFSREHSPSRSETMVSGSPRGQVHSRFSTPRAVNAPSLFSTPPTRTLTSRHVSPLPFYARRDHLSWFRASGPGL